MARLTIRPMTKADVPRLLRYWTQASREDLQRMAVDESKIPKPEVLRAQLEALVDTPESSTKSFYMVWCVDERPVGYSSLKNIHHGDRAEMHLHMWDAGLRGQGYGAALFCLSALDFYDRFRLQRIICEPNRANPMPNAMLRRVGFPLLGTRVGASSDLSAVTELNTYEIGREIAEHFLEERESASPKA